MCFNLIVLFYYGAVAVFIVVLIEYIIPCTSVLSQTVAGVSVPPFKRIANLPLLSVIAWLIEPEFDIGTTLVPATTVYVVTVPLVTAGDGTAADPVCVALVHQCINCCGLVNDVPSTSLNEAEIALVPAPAPTTDKLQLTKLYVESPIIFPVTVNEPETIVLPFTSKVAFGVAVLPIATWLPVAYN